MPGQPKRPVQLPLQRTKIEPRDDRLGQGYASPDLPLEPLPLVEGHWPSIQPLAEWIAFKGHAGKSGAGLRPDVVAVLAGDPGHSPWMARIEVGSLPRLDPPIGPGLTWAVPRCRTDRGQRSGRNRMGPAIRTAPAGEKR